MNLTDQQYLDVARQALAECSKPAEVQYVADSMNRYLRETRSRQMLAELVHNHLHPRPQTVVA